MKLSDESTTKLGGGFAYMFGATIVLIAYLLLGKAWPLTIPPVAGPLFLFTGIAITFLFFFWWLKGAVANAMSQQRSFLSNSELLSAVLAGMLFATCTSVFALSDTPKPAYHKVNGHWIRNR